MKVLLEIPDRYKGRFSAFMGKVCVAYKEEDGPLMMKTSDCSRCGKCCLDCGSLGYDSNNLPVCKHERDMPFICCLTPFYSTQAHEDCTVRFEET